MWYRNSLFAYKVMYHALGDCLCDDCYCQCLHVTKGSNKLFIQPRTPISRIKWLL